MNIRALVYGDADPDSMDATARWAQSMTQALAAAGCATMLLLRNQPGTDVLTAPLAGLPNVTVRHPKTGAHRIEIGRAHV